MQESYCKWLFCQHTNWGWGLGCWGQVPVGRWVRGLWKPTQFAAGSLQTLWQRVEAFRILYAWIPEAFFLWVQWWIRGNDDNVKMHSESPFSNGRFLCRMKMNENCTAWRNPVIRLYFWLSLLKTHVYLIVKELIRNGSHLYIASSCCGLFINCSFSCWRISASFTAKTKESSNCSNNPTSKKKSSMWSLN